MPCSQAKKVPPTSVSLQGGSMMGTQQCRACEACNTQKRGWPQHTRGLALL